MTFCNAYIRGCDVYISSSVKNTFGIHNDSEPFFKLSQPVSPRELGQRVLEALESYREGVPGKRYVKGVKQPLSPLLIFSGFRSWRAFEKGAVHVSISSSEFEIVITPSDPRPQGGYLYRPERAVRCQIDPEEIGKLLLEQDSKCPTP